ncbi:MAG: lipocalin family protein [Cytophagaceae bacterium]
MNKNYRHFFTLIFILLVCSMSSCGKKKSELLSKDWKATKLNLSGNEIGGDMISLEYSFKPDGNFSRTEDGKKEDGKWSLSEDGKKLELELADKTKVSKDVNELTETQLVLAGEEHSMMRTETFEVKK